MAAESDQVYVSIMSYWTKDADGVPHLIREGARYAASSGFPSQHPTAWLRDGATDLEIGRAKAALMPDVRA